MIELRDHGGTYSSGKYKKGNMVDIANLSHPTSYPINKLFSNSSSSEDILKLVNGYLYRVFHSGSTHFITKYSFVDDGIGSVICTQVAYSSITNSYSPTSLLYVPGQSDLLYGAGPVLYKLNPNTLNTTGIAISFSYNIVCLYLLSNGNILVILNSSNNGAKEVKVLDSSYNLITTKSINSTYIPVILPDGKVAYTDSNQDTYIYDSYTNTTSALMFSGYSSNVSIISSYDRNTSFYGLSFGNIFVFPYNDVIKFYNYSNSQLSYVASVIPKSSYGANIMKLNESTIYVLVSDNEYLIEVSTKVITSPSKPIFDRSVSSSNTTLFLAFEFPKSGKSFICSTQNNGFFCPVFKTKILN